jgi:hypothetical protein
LLANLLAIAGLLSGNTVIYPLAGEDGGAHLVDHWLGIAAGDVLLAVAGQGSDDTLLNPVLAGAGGGDVA